MRGGSPRAFKTEEMTAAVRKRAQHALAVGVRRTTESAMWGARAALVSLVFELETSREIAGLKAKPNTKFPAAMFKVLGPKNLC